MRFARKLSSLLFILILVAGNASLYAQEQAPFDVWLQALRQEALGKGYKPETIELAFSEITAPLPRVITNDRNQAEVVETYNDYLGKRVSEWKIGNGRNRMELHGATLRDVAEQYGVQPRFIVAIWGMETNFGTYPIPEPLFNVLATLAYDPRRADLFRAQFFDALAMLDSGFPTYDMMKSSWAGAMGQSQFIPENYLRFAVDHDGDGKRDIWNTEADVFASIANYLSTYGWDDTQTWGRRVKLPANLDLSGAGNAPNRNCGAYRSLGPWKDLQQWQALGVRQENGSDLPVRSMPAALIEGDKDDGEGYIVYGNFCSIMRFNPAFKYALSIGLLSDQLDD